MRALHSAPVAEGGTSSPGKYKVERLLGAGGMGVVVAARHMQLDQLVALKFVLPSAVEDKLAKERFLREAQGYAVRLKSEHVAKVLDVGTLETGAPYIVMEYLEGTNLAEVVATQSPLNPETACDYLIQACEALSEAHSHGIVHRDLKPQNLFLTKGVGGAALVKVLDFGISKIKQPEGAQNLTQTATVVGSPLYVHAPGADALGAQRRRANGHLVARRRPLRAAPRRASPFRGGGAHRPRACDQDRGRAVHPLVAHRERADGPAAGPRGDRSRAAPRRSPRTRYANAGELASALEPFAPLSSHVVADRARKVVSASQETMGMAVPPLLPPGASMGRCATSPPSPSPPHTSFRARRPGWSETTGQKGDAEGRPPWRSAVIAGGDARRSPRPFFVPRDRPRAPAADPAPSRPRRPPPPTPRRRPPRSPRPPPDPLRRRRRPATPTDRAPRGDARPRPPSASAARPSLSTRRPPRPTGSGPKPSPSSAPKPTIQAVMTTSPPYAKGEAS